MYFRIGASADLDLCLRIKSDVCKDEDVMVVAGDMMFQDQKFDLRLLQIFRLHWFDRILKTNCYIQRIINPNRPKESNFSF